MTLDGNLDLTANGSHVTISNGLSLNGTATLNSGGSTDAALLFSGTQTLGGTGTVLFNNSTATGGSGYPVTGMFLTANTTTLTIGPNVTIHGGGAEIGQNDGGGWTSASNVSLVVQGTIDADSSGKYIYVDGTNWINSGTLQAQSGGTLSLVSTPLNFASGTLTGGTWSVGASSTLNLPGGNLTTDAATIILGGPGATFAALSHLAVITATGSLELAGGASFTTVGNVDNSGTIDLAPGTLNVTGTETEESTGSFGVGIGGATAGNQFGQLNVTGAASLGGGLVITVLNGYSTALSDTYKVMTFGSVSGSFATETGLYLSGGLEFYPTFNTGNLSLVVGVSTMVSWINPSGGDWDTASNWSTDAVPNATDDVTISIAVSGPITHNASASDFVHSLTSPDPITISAGSLSLATASIVNSLTLAGGALTGSGNLDVSNSFLWTAGNLGSSGTITLGAGAQMTISGVNARSGGGQAVNSTAAGAAVTWTAGTLEGTLNVTGNFNIAASSNPYLYYGTLNLSDGSGTWSGDYTLFADGDSTFNIGTGFTLNDQVDVSINHADDIGGDTSDVVVAGTLEKTEVSATNFLIPVDNSGTINVTSGNINLNDGGTISARRLIHRQRHHPVRRWHDDHGRRQRHRDQPRFQRRHAQHRRQSRRLHIRPERRCARRTGQLQRLQLIPLDRRQPRQLRHHHPGAGALMTISGVNARSGGGQAVNSTAAGAAVTWTAGTLEGTLNVTGNFNIAASSNPYLYYGTLNLSDGSGTWSGDYTLFADGDSTFNIGTGFTLNDQIDVSINHADNIGGDTSDVVVAGTLEKTEGFATNFLIPVDNSGTINVTSGNINLDDGGIISAGASFTGSGTTQFGGGTMTMAGGNVTATNLAFSGGTLSTAGNLGVSTFDQSGGVLEGSGNLNVSSSFLWTSGNLGSTGTITLGAGAQMTISGSSTRGGGGQAVNSTAAGAAVTWTSGTLEGTLNVTGNFNIAASSNPYLYYGTLNLSDGSGTWTGSYTLFADGDSTFNIGTGFTLNDQVDVSINHADNIGGDTSDVVVAGTLEKTQGSATTFLIPVDISGTIAADSGTLDLAAPPTNLSSGTLTGGTWNVGANSALAVAGGNITTDAATIILGGAGASFPALSQLASITNAGSLGLMGGASFTTAGSLANAGVIDLAPGTLKVNGNYTQASTRSLDVGVGGTTAGSQFGQLNVTGAVSLGGILNVSVLNGYAPSLGNSYQVSSFGSVTGSFSAETGLIIGGGLDFNPSLSTTSLTLVVVASETYTVTTTADTGPGSLRDAITSADSTGLQSTINFQIGTGSQTISPSSALPAITVPILIDGTSQPGYSGTPLILLDGASAGAGTTGLVISANGVTVKGLIISGFGSAGIQVIGNDAWIESNYIGTSAAGTSALANGAAGINVVGSDNTIGGTTAGAGNLISGNSEAGIVISDINNLIVGNKVGTNAAGTAALANNGDGIDVFASANTIGGTAAGAGNVISGNSGDGVQIQSTTGVLVVGNLIGTNAADTAAVPNAGLAGIMIYDANSNTIGGTAAGAGNVISGNAGNGIQFNPTYASSPYASNNLIQGNDIGVTGTGNTPLGNGGDGIFAWVATGNTFGGTAAGAGNIFAANHYFGLEIDNSSQNVVAGNLVGIMANGSADGNGDGGVSLGNASGNTVGGTSSGARNVISGNSRDGILVSGASASSNVIAGDYIGTNAAGSAAVGNSVDGIVIQSGATGNTIGGTASGARNIISGNATDGVYLSAANNLVEGNRMGTNTAGTAALGNGGAGVSISSSGNTIGGTAAGAGNVLSGNSNGVYIALATGTGNLVEGNLIGTDASGTVAISNSASGVAIYGAATANTIGGTTSGSSNVISGSGSSGVAIAGVGTTSNVVEGDLIGTNAAGTVAIPNAAYGVVVYGAATNNTVGGTAAGARNIISGNGVVGVFFTGTGTSGNTAAGNYIGTNAAGTAALANATYGVVINGGASGDTIGGSTAAARNVISGNTTYGIAIFNAGSNSNLVAANFIGTNAGGNAAVANGQDGIIINGSASNNTVGGATASSLNVISGNSSEGVRISGTGTTGNVVAGNYIGTDDTGTVVVSNYAGIEIDSGAAGNVIGYNGVGTAERNVISGNRFTGVWITGAGTDSNNVAGNFIGTSVTGNTALGNGSTYVVSGDDAINGGVLIDEGASDNLIGTSGQLGGNDANQRNVISGNAYTAVVISDAGTSNNVVAGNYLGTTASGQAALTNGTHGDGVDIANGASGNWIGVNPNYGPEDTDQGNVISGGNTTNGWGVWIDPTSSGNVIAGNLIGTDPTGVNALPNALGVYIQSAGNRVGTNGDGIADGIERNVISASAQQGIVIFGTAAVHNVIAGNLIGTNASGTTALGNNVGIAIEGGSTANTIGGTTSGAGNLISGGLSAGVSISGAGTSGNILLGNLIGTNFSGTKALANATGVVIDASASANTIGGLTTTPGTGAGNLISGNAGDGIDLFGNSNAVLGNLIGLDSSGEHILVNGPAGLFIDGGANNIIGGTTASAANVISGNQIGINFAIAGSSGNAIEGNLIGTDKTGTVALGNLADGILVTDPSHGLANTIGGTSAVAGNVISGNQGYGLAITSNATDIVAEGNLIGTDITGTAALGNASDGVYISNSSANTIGGTVAGSGNVISGNQGDGVDNVDASSNVIVGNWIGTNAQGTSVLGNTGDGVFVGGSSSVIVGGTTLGAGNLISGNASNGVEINDSTGSLIQGNLIGLDQTGTVALGTGAAGVLIDDGSVSNTIGGPVPGGRNFISGNAVGIQITGSTTAGTDVAGNLIGTDIEGTGAVGNLTAGISVAGATGTTIGGTSTLARNVISGNDGDGIDVTGGATNTVVLGDYIGSDQTGTKALANAGSAMSLNDALGVTIGGSAEAPAT